MGGERVVEAPSKHISKLASPDEQCGYYEHYDEVW